MSKRGQGHVYRPTYRDRKTGRKKQQKVWWVAYSVRGRRYRESSGSSRQRDAVKFLHQRLAEHGQGISRRDVERVTYEDLQAVIMADYDKNRRKSVVRLGNSLAHLGARFRGWRALDITEDAIDAYAAERLTDRAAPGTVNRELAALRRMFRLGYRARMVLRVPSITLLTENNVRVGFVEDQTFAALEAELPEHLRSLAVCGFVTGWRKQELLSRRWGHVDLGAGWIRLEPGETKNGEGRQFPLIPRLRETLEAQYARRQTIERRSGRIMDSLFFYDTGNPIKDFRSAWKSACRRAGCPGLLFHDLRRTSARNLIRSGVPERIAMDLTGHLTPSVFKRYAIVDEGMLREGAAKLTALYDDTAGRPERKVLPLDG
jgi:integrase